MDLINLIFLSVGLLLGVGIGILYLKSKKNHQFPESGDLKIQLKLEMERSAKFQEELRTLDKELKAERGQVHWFE